MPHLPLCLQLAIKQATEDEEEVAARKKRGQNSSARSTRATSTLARHRSKLTEVQDVRHSSHGLALFRCLWECRVVQLSHLQTLRDPKTPLPSPRQKKMSLDSEVILKTLQSTAACQQRLSSLNTQSTVCYHSAAPSFFFPPSLRRKSGAVFVRCHFL